MSDLTSGPTAASVRPPSHVPEHRGVKKSDSISEKMPDGLERLDVIADDLDYHHHGYPCQLNLCDGTRGTRTVLGGSQHQVVTPRLACRGDLSIAVSRACFKGLESEWWALTALRRP